MRKQNILFKHAVLTKLALIAALLFISLWLWTLDGETPTARDDMELPGTGEVVDANGNKLSCSEISVEGNSGLKPRSKKPLEATTSLHPSSAIKPTPRPNTNVLRAETFLLHDKPHGAACPQSSILPNVSEYPKISGGELYNRLIEERYVPWYEPIAKDLGIK